VKNGTKDFGGPMDLSSFFFFGGPTDLCPFFFFGGPMDLSSFFLMLGSGNIEHPDAYGRLLRQTNALSSSLRKSRVWRTVVAAQPKRIHKISIPFTTRSTDNKIRSHVFQFCNTLGGQDTGVGWITHKIDNFK
jgi:hypothetical protein